MAKTKQQTYNEKRLDYIAQRIQNFLNIRPVLNAKRDKPILSPLFKEYYELIGVVAVTINGIEVSLSDWSFAFEYNDLNAHVCFFNDMEKRRFENQ